MREELMTAPPAPGYVHDGWYCLYHRGLCHNPLDCTLVPKWRLSSRPTQAQIDGTPPVSEATEGARIEGVDDAALEVAKRFMDDVDEAGDLISALRSRGLLVDLDPWTEWHCQADGPAILNQAVDLKSVVCSPKNPIHGAPCGWKDPASEEEVEEAEGDPYENRISSESCLSLRRASGRVNDPRALVSFLYELMRDELPAGKVQELVNRNETVSAGNPAMFTNGGLASYAQYLADRLGVTA